MDKVESILLEALDAGGRVLKRYAEGVDSSDVHYKDEINLVTIADLESDRPLALLRMGRLYRDRFQDLPTAEGYFEKAMDSARRSGNPAEEEQGRKEILELKKMREQMRKEAVLIDSHSNQKE